MEAQQRIALITGGSRGLGRDMAISLAKKGVDSIITYRNKKDEAIEVVREIEALGRKASYLKLDLNEPGQLTAFAQVVEVVLE